MVEAPIFAVRKVVKEIREFVSYKPTDEEKRQGLMSSVNSRGLGGTVNRALARLCRQEEVDIKAFINHWTNPLSN